jgi:hypothetical protein
VKQPAKVWLNILKGMVLSLVEYKADLMASTTGKTSTEVNVQDTS